MVGIVSWMARSNSQTAERSGSLPTEAQMESPSFGVMVAQAVDWILSTGTSRQPEPVSYWLASTDPVTECRHRYRAVNGHRDLPTGGHRNSPRTASTIPQGRPQEVPADGHGKPRGRPWDLPTGGPRSRR